MSAHNANITAIPAPVVDVPALLTRARSHGLAADDASHRAGSPYVRVHGHAGDAELDFLVDTTSGHAFGTAAPQHIDAGKRQPTRAPLREQVFHTRVPANFADPQPWHDVILDIVQPQPRRQAA